MKSVRPCTLFMANFGKAEISLLFKPAASVPLLKMLDVQKVRLRFISARLLASAPPICKSAGKAQLLRAAHKLILNVAEAARMPLVLRKGDVFAQRKLVVEKRTRKYAFQQPAVNLCSRLVISERTRMSVD